MGLKPVDCNTGLPGTRVNWIIIRFIVSFNYFNISFNSQLVFLKMSCVVPVTLFIFQNISYYLTLNTMLLNLKMSLSLAMLSFSNIPSRLCLFGKIFWWSPSVWSAIYSLSFTQHSRESPCLDHWGRLCLCRSHECIIFIIFKNKKMKVGFSWF